VAGDEAVLNELRAQTNWLRLLGLQTLRPLLIQMLTDERQRVAYELTDGKRSGREVGDVAGVAQQTVSRWWGDWLAAGICSEVPGIAGRAQRLASLTSLGIDLPKGYAKGASGAAKA
jgi:hypothetical protein